MSVGTKKKKNFFAISLFFLIFTPPCFADELTPYSWTPLEDGPGGSGDSRGPGGPRNRLRQPVYNSAHSPKDSAFFDNIPEEMIDLPEFKRVALALQRLGTVDSLELCRREIQVLSNFGRTEHPETNRLNNSAVLLQAFFGVLIKEAEESKREPYLRSVLQRYIWAVTRLGKSLDQGRDHSVGEDLIRSDLRRFTEGTLVGSGHTHQSLLGIASEHPSVALTLFPYLVSLDFETFYKTIQIVHSIRTGDNASSVFNPFPTVPSFYTAEDLSSMRTELGQKFFYFLDSKSAHDNEGLEFLLHPHAAVARLEFSATPVASKAYSARYRKDLWNRKIREALTTAILFGFSEVPDFGEETGIDRDDWIAAGLEQAPFIKSALQLLKDARAFLPFPNLQDHRVLEPLVRTIYSLGTDSARSEVSSEQQLLLQDWTQFLVNNQECAQLLGISENRSSH